MIPIPGRRRIAARLAPLLALAVTGLVAACGAPGATFSADGPCLADGRAGGAYAELEALVPRDLDGRAPTTVDSGRSCSDRALGSLKARGLTELRFAGATWDEGDGAGTTIAVLASARDGASLPAAWIEEFYEAGARASTKASNVETSRSTMGEAGPVWRLDTLNDLSLQTVVVRPIGDLVQVVLVATAVNPDASLAEHEARVELAVEVAAAGPVLPSAR